MSQPASTTHIVNRTNYTNHHLINLPSSPLPPLPSSSIRIRPRILGLTTNNLSYARMGAILGWFSTYPLPPNTPAPFNDATTYARIAAWGYAEIVASNVPGISVGRSLYGFLPITDGIETMGVEFAKVNGEEIPDQIVVVDEHRQSLMKLYNRYQIHAPLSELEKSPGLESLGYDALMWGLFMCSFNLNRYVFTWDAQKRVHPSGEGKWGAEDADLRDAVVVALNASGKTAMSFAYCLRRDRPVEEQPRRIIGVGSEKSVDMIRGTGLFDDVLLNGGVGDIEADVEVSRPSKVVLIDFGARTGVASAWFDTLSLSSIPVSRITVGGEVAVLDAEAMQSRIADRENFVAANASALREWGIQIGGKEYFEGLAPIFEDFKGYIKGMTLEWGNDWTAWGRGWDALCSDQAKADVGLVYHI